MCANAYGVHAYSGAVQRDIAHRHAVGQQLIACTHRDGVRERVGRENVLRRTATQSQPAALADGEQVRPAVLAEHHPVTIDDRPRPRVQAAVASEEGLLAGAGEKAQILRLRPSCSG